jgi:hypothetical protein
MDPPDDNFQYRLAYPVAVPIVGDALDEPDEQFTVLLFIAKLATIGRGTGIATIVDDDAPPTAVTGAAGGVGPDGAALAGLANPGTKATSAWFEYGPTTAYGSSTPATALPGDGTARTIGAALSGLQFGTGYHFRLVAANATGTAYGADNAFTTTYPPAEASTGGASAVTSTAATLAGTARTYGLGGTAWFEYGTTTALGRSTQPQAVAPGAPVSVVNDTLTGLAEGTTYHYRLVVRRGDEVAAGEDESFSTSALVRAPTGKPKAKPKPPSFSAVSSGAVSGSTVVFAVRCVAAKPSCRGSILLDASNRSLSIAGRSTARVGQAAFTRRPGGVVTVRVKLTRKALDALRKTHRLPVLATITVRDSAGKATRTMRLTLTLPRTF